MSSNLRVESSRGPYEISFLRQTDDVIRSIDSFLSKPSPSMALYFQSNRQWYLWNSFFTQLHLNIL